MVGQITNLCSMVSETKCGHSRKCEISSRVHVLTANRIKGITLYGVGKENFGSWQHPFNQIV